VANLSRNKRGIDDVQDGTEEELYQGILGMQEPFRSCCALIYLTGNRVSEIVGIPEEEKVRQYGGLWKLRPVTPSSFTRSKENPIVKLTTRTLKRKKPKDHAYIFRIDNEYEKRYWSIVEAHMKDFAHDAYPWNVSRFRVWKALEKATSREDRKSPNKPTVKATGLTPHKLRSLRASRDAVTYRMGALELKEKFNWGSSEMPFKYARMNTLELENRLMGK
jgi:hypothetical protein